LPENTDFFLTAKIHALKGLTEPNNANAQKSALAAEAMATIAVAEEMRTANILRYYQLTHNQSQLAEKLGEVRSRLNL
jgi:hypothetical protein